MAKTRALRMAIGLVVIAPTGAAFAQELPDPLAGRSFSVVDGAGQPVVDCPGCQPGTNVYRLNGSRDALALIYAGVPHTGTTTGQCDGPVRRSLVSNWATLHPAPCGTDCPAGLRHAFRPSDLSADTRRFATLLGLPELPPPAGTPGAVPRSIPFCNAHSAGPLLAGQSDILDRDPIRVPCSRDGEQVCTNARSDLGLVVVIDPPSNLTSAQNYPAELCDAGMFRWLSVGFNGPRVCPHGHPTLFNKCLQAARLVADQPSGFTAQCMARFFPVPGIDGPYHDGRVLNLWTKDHAGKVLKDAHGRLVTAAFYRLHTTTTRVPAAQPCRSADPAEQIRCLVSAQGCSIGFTAVAPDADPLYTHLAVSLANSCPDPCPFFCE